MLKRLLIAVVLMFFAAATYARSPITTTWVNQRGSEMTIASVDGSGLISGSYVNKATGFKCQNSPYSLTGWTDGNNFTISVMWKNASEDCKSMTTWIGSLDGDTLKLQWKLAYTDTQGKPAIMDGSDDFTRK